MLRHPFSYISPCRALHLYTVPYLQLRSLTRYSQRNSVGGRSTRKRAPVVSTRGDRIPRDVPSTRAGLKCEEQPTIEDSPLWSSSQSRPSVSPKEALKGLLSNETLIITRQLEMMNILVGFEQANRYAITNKSGESLGYIAEEPRGFLSVFSRQILRTHRPFRALILDREGSPILWLRRPFAWINSRMFVQKLKSDYHPAEGERILDTFAEVQQRWHIWRRRYDLFMRETPLPILSKLSERQPEPDLDSFRQFARIDEGLWAWHFNLYDARGEEIASVNRAFRGFGREIFTDTGQYVIRFSPNPDVNSTEAQQSSVVRDLSLEEKALVLALSVNVDFDYFSRHSEGSHWGFPLWWGGGSD